MSNTKLKIKTFFIRLSHWEYWNFNIVYFPIYFYWLFLCLRARNLFFFNASNPSIENGGYLMERKSDIYDIIPEALYPKTILVKENLSNKEIESIITKNNFIFPLIVKPDIGGKGRGVKKINTIEDAVAYIQYAKFPMLVQALVEYKNEVGIFYYRYPWQQNGKITGIVSKEFVTVKGDGKSTLRELILQNPRYALQLEAFSKMPDLNLNEIITNGKEKILMQFGNHARGAKFIDSSNNINPTLEKNIDDICKQIPGFYFGRLDIMYSTWDNLCNGKNLCIIELNGAGSEPTHIYDPEHSIFFAWKEIVRHLNILYKISVYNHKQNGEPYLSFSKGIKMFKEVGKVEKKLDGLLC